MKVVLEKRSSWKPGVEKEERELKKRTGWKVHVRTGGKSEWRIGFYLKDF